MDNIIIEKIVPKGASHCAYGYANDGKVYDMRKYAFHISDEANSILLDNGKSDFVKGVYEILIRNNQGRFWRQYGREYIPLDDNT